MAGALPFRSWKALGGSAAFELRGLPAPAGGNGVESRLRVGFSYIFLTCTSSWETKGVSQQSCAFFFHLLYVFVDSASGMSPVWHCADLDDPQSWTHYSCSITARMVSTTKLCRAAWGALCKPHLSVKKCLWQGFSGVLLGSCWLEMQCDLKILAEK